MVLVNFGIEGLGLRVSSLRFGEPCWGVVRRGVVCWSSLSDPIQF